MITFLLTDVVGSTALWDTQALAMAEALLRHDALIEATVVEHGGTLVKSKGEGDSTFSVFDRASDAAGAAVAIHRALAEEPWPGGLALRVRAGIHVGEVIAREGDFYGPTVNRVARLRGLADAGETLVSRTTAELLTDHVGPGWHLEEVGLKALRGLSRPEHVYRLVDPEVPRSEAEASSARFAPPSAALPSALAGDGSLFVGRRTEGQQMRTAWREVLAGRARVVLLAGEPGIGKTSLAADLARLAASEGATVLYGRGDEHVAVAYQPFLEPMRALVAAADDAALASDPRAAAELTRLVPELADRLAGLPEPITGEAEAERHALFEAVRGLLTRAGAERPILLVLDDLHWATAPTALLLGHLLRSSTPGLLLIGTYRDTEVDDDHPLQPVLADAWRLPGVERVDVRGLDTDAVTALLEAASGHEMDDQGTELAQRLEAGTGGNPFFVLELLRHLAESRVIYEEAGRWTSEVDLASITLPGSVVDVLRQRLARLPADALQILTVAAVAGPELDVDLIERVVDLRDDLVLDALDAAIDAGLLVERAEGLSFAHALVRASLMAGISTLRRRRWHRTLGDVLAARPEGRRSVEALAHHYGEAAQADASLAVTAARFGLAATQKAADALAPEVALAHVGRALTALDLDPQGDIDLRCDLLLAAAAASFAVVGRTDGCRRPALAAGADALALGDPERVAQAAELALGGLVMTYDTSYELEIIEGALQLPASEPLQARLTAARALALLGAGRAGDLDVAADGVRRARSCGDETALIAALHARSASLLRSSDLAERLAIAEELARLRGTASGVASRVALSPTDVELYRGAALLTGRDLDGLATEIAILEERYELNGDWELRYFSIAHQACLATIRGDLQDLDRLAGEMISHDATRPPDPELESFHPVSDGSTIGNNSLRLYAAYQFILHRERGVLEDLLPLFRDAVESDPTIAVFRAALAVAEADLGLLAEGRSTFDSCLAGGIDALPQDQIWPLLIGCLCEGCGLLDVPEWAPALRAAAEPHSGQIVTGAIATIAFDLFDRCLGMLDVAEGLWDDAIDRFDSATEQAAELGATVWEVRALAWSGHAHARRGSEGDAEKAAELHRQATERADRLGYPGLQAAVVRLAPLRS